VERPEGAQDAHTAVTGQQVIALSGHRTPEAARGYIKRTEAQREAALLKRRAWVAAVKEEPADRE
jgi:hypothetical protein